MKTSVQNKLATLMAMLITATALAFPSVSSAVTVVTSAADNPVTQPLIPGTLRHALANAPLNDTIAFAPSLNGKTIILKGGQLVVDRSVTIQGPGLDRLAVSGGSVSRVFFVSGSLGANVEISGLTITKGNGTGLGYVDGGAIFNRGVLGVKRCAITSSRCAGSGGAIYNEGDFREVTDSTIAFNNAVGDGGAIWDVQNILIQRCAIFSNTAGGSGGGVQEQGTSKFINCTIASNTAAGSGGGINDSGATIDVYNCTISLNTASVGGGLAVPEFGSSTTLRNTIIAGNNKAGPSTPAPNVSDMFLNSGSGFLISAGNNLIGSTVGALPGSFLPSDQQDVLDPKLGPLKDNGGITLTMELLPGSPAIDAGNNASVLASMTSDQRGTFNRIIHGTVDVGAFEYVAPRDLKNGALTELSACTVPTGDSETARHLSSAIRNIQKSLAPSLWLDDSHLKKCGELVFEYEEEAVEALLDIVGDGGACALDAQNAIDDLVLADELLARIAITEAITGGGRDRDIASAQASLARGVDALTKGKFHQSMDFFEHAWIDAQHSLGRKCGCDDDDEHRERAARDKEDHDRYGDD